MSNQLSNNKEKRILFTDNSDFSISQSTDGKPVTLTGYALKWNTLSTDRGGYFVRLLPGSANFVTPTFAVVNHDCNNLLARSDDGSLRLFSDDVGVKCEIDMPDTQLGKDTTWLVANGKIRGMSFAMIPNENMKSHDTTEDGKDVVNFEAFDCDEVTATPIPAFEDTTIGVKSAELTSGIIRLSNEDARKQQFELQRINLNFLASLHEENLLKKATTHKE